MPSTRASTTLDLTLTPEARQAIDGHARLLLAWTSSINLTAIRDPEAVATAHIVDSLTAVEVLARPRRRAVPGPRVRRRLSGPAPCRGPARRTALLVEPIAKKARFLETVIAATGLTATVEAAADPIRGARRGPAPSGPVAGRDRPRRRAARRARRAGVPPPRAGRDPGRLEARRPRGRGGGRPAGDGRPRRRHARGRAGVRARPRRPRAGRRHAPWPRAPTPTRATRALRRRRPW